MLLRRTCWAPSGPRPSDTVKIGVILPMTGQQASTGRQIDAAIKLWVAQNGKKVAARPSR
jgi:branched-chain amino acid transport system substrate-binding protein